MDASMEGGVILLIRFKQYGISYDMYLDGLSSR